MRALFSEGLGHGNPIAILFFVYIYWSRLRAIRSWWSRNSMVTIVLNLSKNQIGLVRWDPTPPPGALHGFRTRDLYFSVPAVLFIVHNFA